MTVDPDVVIRRMGEGARTGQIARRMGHKTDTVRRVLRKLEAEKRVFRDAQFSYDNDIYWRPSFSSDVGDRV